jgi:hypothetical protein
MRDKDVPDWEELKSKKQYKSWAFHYVQLFHLK